jgi:hypothetical protein
MTTLKAVQRICMFCGLRTPAGTDTGKSSDAGLAETYLDEASAEIQSAGWPENTENGLKLTPTAGAITTSHFGTDVLSIRTWGADAHTMVRLVGAALEWYDSSQTADPWTATFTQSELSVTVIRNIAFTNLPESLAHYITSEAARNFFAAEVFETGGIDKQRKFELRRRIEGDWLRTKAVAEQQAWQQHSAVNNLLSTDGARLIRGRERGYGTSFLLGTGS